MNTSFTRVVLKLGTQVVIEEQGRFARLRLAKIVADCARAHKAGKEILLVTSGAVGLGSRELQLDNPARLVDKQACAAVGQALLMDAYRELFEGHGIRVAQVLLTGADFADRKRYLRLRQTIDRLLEWKTIPVINENDTVSIMELQDGVYSTGFGDNDRLSALVAAKLGAELLIILTDVDGLYSGNPKTTPGAKRIERIDSFTDLAKVSLNGHSELGRGGMTSKVAAARIASISGVDTIITSGFDPDVFGRILDSNDKAGTGTFVQGRRRISGRQHWIGFASGTHGSLIINEGAGNALFKEKASLLAVGVSDAKGEFEAGQVVSIQDPTGGELGRGISNFSSREVKQVLGLHSHEVARALSRSGPTEIIHRDNLVLFRDPS